MMNFSVLLSLYEKEQPDFLFAALDSVFNQTCPPPEVILVLDGEITDELHKVVTEFKTLHPQVLKIIRLEKNMGLGPALNEGLKHCSHELVARMDTDDICCVERFEKQIAVFKRNPRIDIVSSWIAEFYDSPDKIYGIKKIPEIHENLKRYARKRCPVNHPVVMYKKHKIFESGGYESLGFLEDYVLWMKLLKNGAVFYNIQDSLLLFRSNKDMYKRRGGFRYAVDEFKLQQQFLGAGMINRYEMIRNLLLRLPVRLSPTVVRTFIYKQMLRKLF